MKSVNININKMIDLYVGQKLTAKACALKLGVSQSALVRRLKKIGIKVRPPTRRFVVDITDEQVIDLYWNQKLSISQTAKALNRSERLVKDRLHK